MNEQPHTIANSEFILPVADSGRNPTRRVAAFVLLLFWIGQFGSNSIYQQLTWPKGAAELLFPRALICTAGLILSFGLIGVQNRLRDVRLLVRAEWAFGLAIAGAATHALVNHLIFAAFLSDYGGGAPFWVSYSVEVLDRLWVFACLSAMTLALAYAAEIQEREERISALQALAHNAQLRALRSQLNPHFLFNALNSMAALIKARRNPEAEAMVEDLADFLRTTLALDSHRLITLKEELRLQQLYLDVQRSRFPDRLRVEVDIAGPVEHVLVPNLIAQPLVENSIKHAVARSTRPVTLSIAARKRGERLELSIEDDGGDAHHGTAKGGRVGLANVVERLRAHYGDRARLDARLKPGGGFQNILLIPLAGGQ